MSADIEPPEPAVAEEKAERAKTRRRWLTLAELVAVAGVLIAGANFYTNWSDHRDQIAERSAADRASARDKARIELIGTVASGGKVLKLSDADHDLSEASVAFPKALGIATQHPAGDPEIDADWFSGPILKLTDGGSDDKTGRVPVLVTVRYFVGDDARTTSAIYDVIWRTKGHFLGGRSLRIDGMKLRQRSGNQAALDAAWAKLKPQPKAAG